MSPLVLSADVAGRLANGVVDIFDADVEFLGHSLLRLQLGLGQRGL